jgi:hypothetical protein
MTPRIVGATLGSVGLGSIPAVANGDEVAVAAAPPLADGVAVVCRKAVIVTPRMPRAIATVPTTRPTTMLRFRDA